MKTLMAQHRSSARATETARGGFTLVEMMVATTLVVMMMLMFAQIYVAAIDSLGEQQAVARNDGKARLVDTILQGDLDKISYLSTPNSNQGIVPLVRDDVVQSWQRGFFYISENDQTNPNDDVLHFTTSIKTARNRDQSMYYGRARNVAGVLVYGTGASPQFPNHPEIDDGDTGNDVGASRDAEVCYFVRGGNLYRRVLLIRDIDLAGVPGTNAAQPSQGTVDFNATITPANGPTTPSYYKAFDYSAYCRLGATDSVRFLGTDALQNHSVAAIYSTESLGCSMTRFGFAISEANQTNTIGDPTLRAMIRARGVPVEYDSLGNFFGRPLHAETGSYQWQWPGTRSNPLNGPGLVYNPTTDQLSLPAPVGLLVDTDGSTTNYTRATEDLLLSNVEAFDIEVWDPGFFEDFDRDGVADPAEASDLNNNGVIDPAEVDLNGNGFLDQAAGFVQLGNTTENTGYFRANQRRNAAYGPGGPLGNWVFDTGHPDMWTETGRSLSTPFSSYGAAQRPPYRPLQYRVVELDIDADGNADPNEDINGNGVLDTLIPVHPVQPAHLWYPGVTYSSGDVVFRPLDTTNDLDIANVTTSGVVYRPFDSTYSIAYRCIASGEDLDGDGVLDAGEDGSQGAPGSRHTAGTGDLAISGATVPQWPTTPGARVTEFTQLSGNFTEDSNGDGVLQPAEDANGNGILDLTTPSSVTWEAFDNRVGLQKIRITIRVRDPKEDLPRQFSIIHSFANPTKAY